MERGFEVFAAFFYGAEKYSGVELSLYDVPGADLFYILQKIPDSDDAVFTIKETNSDNGCSEDADVVYQVIVNLPKMIQDYKKGVRKVFSDKKLLTRGFIIIDKMRDNIHSFSKDYDIDLYDMIKLIRKYDTLRRDPWINKKILPRLQFEDFFNDEELQKLKEVLECNDLKTFLKYYG